MPAGIPNDRGAINFVQIFLYLAIAAVGYYAYVYVPPMLDHFAIKKAVRIGCNQAYARREVEVVHAAILTGFKEAAIQEEYLGVDGSVMTKPLEVGPENISVELRDGPPPSVTTTVTYERRIMLPIFKKERTLRYTYTHSEDLSEVKY